MNEKLSWMRPVFILAGSLALGSAHTACSSEDKKDEQPTVVGFSGVYTPATDGPLATIAFVDDSHYLAMPKGCASKDCAELGSYKYDSKANQLTLTNAANGQTHVIAVNVVSTAKTNQTRLTTKGNCVDAEGQLSSAGCPLTGGQSNTQPGGQSNTTPGGQSNTQPGGDSEVVSQIVALFTKIVEAIMDGQKMKNDDDKKDDPPAAAAQDAGPDDAGVAMPKFKEICRSRIPTPEWKTEEVLKYWVDCPVGPLTPG